jgi:apolipoprotein N-acyltransferase
MTLAHGLSLALAAAAGACTVFAFAPFRISGLVFVTVTLLFWQWQHAKTPWQAAMLGFAFGVGLFAAGASWLTVALVSFGGMPLWLALAAIAILVAYLGLWPAAAGYLAARMAPPGSWTRMIVAAGAFTAAEWVRSYLFTGFPWLALGYSQVPDGLVRGYAPAGGVYLVTLVVTLGAALIVRFVDAMAENGRRASWTAAASALALVVAGIALSRIEWTRPSGPPLPVSLVQGNVLQDIKFDPRFRASTFDHYLRLVDQSRGRLIVLPESAFPVFSDEVPDAVLLSLIRTASARDAHLLVNVTNDAWYGHSIAAEQHNQIAAMRALELGRPMLRATNTGITSAIGQDGREIARLPWFTTGILEVTVAGRTGETPYLRVGDSLVLILCAVLIVAPIVLARRR